MKVKPGAQAVFRFVEVASTLAFWILRLEVTESRTVRCDRSIV